MLAISLTVSRSSVELCISLPSSSKILVPLTVINGIFTPIDSAISRVEASSLPVAI